VYIKGAIAEPWLKIINPPKIIKTISIGIIQNFFLTKINLIISFKKFINFLVNNFFASIYQLINKK
jgi:hypothetical protein